VAGPCWIVIQRSSVNSSSAALPPKRPQPLALTPPNGICGSSWTVEELMWQMPLSIRRATSIARSTSSLNTAAERPYSVSFAVSIASPVPLTGTIVTTGPNDSSS
jgi:hypothetical protein